MQERRARRQRARHAVERVERRDLAAEERRQMARDARVLRIRQAELREADARAAHRPRRRIDLREEAVEDRLREFRA
jgi:hypothetical protein